LIAGRHSIAFGRGIQKLQTLENGGGVFSALLSQISDNGDGIYSRPRRDSLVNAGSVYFDPLRQNLVKNDRIRSGREPLEDYPKSTFGRLIHLDRPWILRAAQIARFRSD